MDLASHRQVWICISSKAESNSTTSRSPWLQQKLTDHIYVAPSLHGISLVGLATIVMGDLYSIFNVMPKEWLLCWEACKRPLDSYSARITQYVPMAARHQVFMKQATWVKKTGATPNVRICNTDAWFFLADELPLDDIDVHDLGADLIMPASDFLEGLGFSAATVTYILTILVPSYVAHLIECHVWQHLFCHNGLGFPWQSDWLTQEWLDARKNRFEPHYSGIVSNARVAEVANRIRKHSSVRLASLDEDSPDRLNLECDLRLLDTMSNPPKPVASEGAMIAVGRVE